MLMTSPTSTTVMFQTLFMNIPLFEELLINCKPCGRLSLTITFIALPLPVLLIMTV